MGCQEPSTKLGVLTLNLRQATALAGLCFLIHTARESGVGPAQEGLKGRAETDPPASVPTADITNQSPSSCSAEFRCDLSILSIVAATTQGLELADLCATFALDEAEVPCSCDHLQFVPTTVLQKAPGCVWRFLDLMFQEPRPLQTQWLLRRPQGEPLLSSVLKHLSREVVREGVPPARWGLVGHGRALSSHSVLQMQVLATWVLQRQGQS